MFYRKNQFLKVQKIHRKALKVMFNNKVGYGELLHLNNEVSIHQKHIHVLICEVFKSLTNPNPESIWSYFVFKDINI